MIDLEAVFGYPETAPDVATPPEAPEVTTPKTSAEAPGFDFSGWIRQPDRKGRMGWERVGLPEWQRWWARCDYEDLPTE